MTELTEYAIKAVKVTQGALVVEIPFNQVMRIERNGSLFDVEYVGDVWNRHDVSILRAVTVEYVLDDELSLLSTKKFVYTVLNCEPFTAYLRLPKNPQAD